MKNNDSLNLKNIEDGEIDFQEILLILWKNKILISCSTILFSIIFIFYSLTLQNIYKSEGLYEIVSKEESSGNMSSLASRYGGIASLVGINLPSGGDESFLVLEKLKSKSFAKHLSEIEGIKENFFAVKRYNSDSSSLEYDPKIFNSETREWTAIRDGKPFIPSAIDFYNALQGRFSVSKNTETGFIEIYFLHRSPNSHMIFSNQLSLK